MRRRLTALATCLAVVAVPLAGCGEEEPGVAKRDASELIRLLRKVQAASDDPQRCDELAADIDAVRVKVRALPSKVDPDVRESLRTGLKNLAESARAQCENAQTTPTETTPTETTPTETVPPVTTETTPPPTTEPTPPPPPTETTPPPTTETTPPPPTTPPAPTTPDTGGTGPGNSGGAGKGIKGNKGKGKQDERSGKGGEG